MIKKKKLADYKYFITGANGLIGSHILRKIAAEKGKIIALKRKRSNLEWVQDIPNVEWVNGKINMPNLSDYLQDVDFVIHCAGLVTFNYRNREKLLQVNRKGTENLVNAALKSSIKKFCHVSSVAALGNTQVHRINEQDTWDNRNPASHYAVSKHLAEREVWRGIAEGLPAVIVNPSVVLGNGNPERSSNKIFNYILKGTLFYPKGHINVVDADDVAKAIYQLLHTDIQSERFILNAQRIEIETLLQLIATEFNRKMPRPISVSSLRKIHKYMKLYDRMVGENSATTMNISSILDAPEYDTSKIEQALQFKFTNPQESIRKICRRYQNHFQK